MIDSKVIRNSIGSVSIAVLSIILLGISCANITGEEEEGMDPTAAALLVLAADSSQAKIKLTNNGGSTKSFAIYTSSICSGGALASFGSLANGASSTKSIDPQSGLSIGVVGEGALGCSGPAGLASSAKTYNCVYDGAETTCS